MFQSDQPEGQHTYATALRTGTAGPAGAGRHWRDKARPVDVFDAKADLAAALDVLGLDIDKLQLVAEPAAWAHPGRGGRIQLGPPRRRSPGSASCIPAWAAELDLLGPGRGVRARSRRRARAAPQADASKGAARSVAI